MIYALVAILCGSATIAGIFLPGAWKAGIALTAFACGINTAIALMGGRS